MSRADLIKLPSCWAVVAGEGLAVGVGVKGSADCFVAVIFTAAVFFAGAVLDFLGLAMREVSCC